MRGVPSRFRIPCATRRTTNHARCGREARVASAAHGASSPTRCDLGRTVRRDSGAPGEQARGERTTLHRAVSVPSRFRIPCDTRRTTSHARCGREARVASAAHGASSSTRCDIGRTVRRDSGAPGEQARGERTTLHRAGRSEPVQDAVGHASHNQPRTVRTGGPGRLRRARCVVLHPVRPRPHRASRQRGTRRASPRRTDNPAPCGMRSAAHGSAAVASLEARCGPARCAQRIGTRDATAPTTRSSGPRPRNRRHSIANTTEPRANQPHASADSG